MRLRQVLTIGFAVIAGVVASGIVPAEREAGACSCGPQEPALISPDRVDDAPLNAHVRYVTRQPQPGAPVRATLRVHGGAVVDTTSRDVVSGYVVDVELVPRAPLTPHTQYELVIESANAFPRADVIGTFRTGDGRDTVAPLFDAPSSVETFYNRTNIATNLCEAHGPWALVHGVHGVDPGRPNARLVYAVWKTDAAGKIDTKQLPTTVLLPDENGVLLLGQSISCDPRRFELPENGVQELGIAAIDEAGNTSALRRVRLDMSAARKP